jgi:L-lysine exporter family protein LysE/ArgO
LSYLCHIFLGKNIILLQTDLPVQIQCNAHINGVIVLSAFFSGFFISLSLILAIGPQNSFVIRQGLLGQYVLAVVLFCGISDAVLICLGVLGLGAVMAPVFTQYSDWMFGLSALWLAIYGAGRVRAAYRGDYRVPAVTDNQNPGTLRAIFALLAVLTFANPHVYLDTVILLGAVSIGYVGLEKLVFAVGASLASLSFFAIIGFGAKQVSPFMRTPKAWQILDLLTALVMFIFAGILLAQTSWPGAG